MPDTPWPGHPDEEEMREVLKIDHNQTESRKQKADREVGVKVGRRSVSGRLEVGVKVGRRSCQGRSEVVSKVGRSEVGRVRPRGLDGAGCCRRPVAAAAR